MFFFYPPPPNPPHPTNWPEPQMDSQFVYSPKNTFFFRLNWMAYSSFVTPPWCGGWSTNCLDQTSLFVTIDRVGAGSAGEDVDTHNFTATTPSQIQRPFSCIIHANPMLIDNEMGDEVIKIQGIYSSKRERGGCWRGCWERRNGVWQPSNKAYKIQATHGFIAAGNKHESLHHFSLLISGTRCWAS